jgi:prevent-host-death family protein
MPDVTIRDLRNNGGRVLQRVVRGESLTVTLHGKPVAELRPVRTGAMPAEQLVGRWCGLPRVNAAKLRAGLDRALDTGVR